MGLRAASAKARWKLLVNVRKCLAVIAAFHGDQMGLGAGEIVFGGVQDGKANHVWFHCKACINQFQGTGRFDDRAAFRRVVIDDISTRARAAFDKAQPFQRFERLADRAASYIILLCQRAFRAAGADRGSDGPS